VQIGIAGSCKQSRHMRYAKAMHNIESGTGVLSTTQQSRHVPLKQAMQTSRFFASVILQGAWLLTAKTWLP